MVFFVLMSNWSFTVISIQACLNLQPASRQILVTLFLIFSGCAAAGENVTYKYTLNGNLCKPEGSGPFPAVIFNHGGAGTIIGGAPEETCAALAKAGFVGFSPIRRPTRPLSGHLDDVNEAVDYMKGLPFVNANRIGIMGFSRGGMLTYQAAARSRDFKAVVIMAVAVNRALNLNEAASISAPVLILVTENDTGSRRTRGMNTFEGTLQLMQAFKAAGKNARLIVYPPFSNDGHTLFFSVGSYWPDVIKFFKQHL